MAQGLFSFSELRSHPLPPRWRGHLDLPTWRGDELFQGERVDSPWIHHGFTMDLPWIYTPSKKIALAMYELQD